MPKARHLLHEINSNILPCSWNVQFESSYFILPVVGVAEELDLMVVVLYLVAVIMSLGLTSCLPHRLFLVHTTNKLNFN